MYNILTSLGRGRRGSVLWLPVILALAIGLAACGGQAATAAGEMDMDADSGEMDMGGDSVETGVEVTHGDLRIKDIWGRPAFQGDTGAAYLTLMNMGEESEVFIGAETDIAAAIELHETKMDGDVMHMQPVAGGVEIPAGGEVAFEPGSYHVMLVDLQQDLKEGESFSLTLEFEKSGEVAVEVMVMQP